MKADKVKLNVNVSLTNASELTDLIRRFQIQLMAIQETAQLINNFEMEVKVEHKPKSEG